MSINNKYVYRSRISEAKFRQLLRLFCLDLAATQIAEIINLSRNSVNTYLKAIRQRMGQLCEAEASFSGQVEVDESYFGGRHAKGKRGRGPAAKPLSLASLNAMEMCIPKWARMPAKRASSELFEEK